MATRNDVQTKKYQKEPLTIRDVEMNRKLLDITILTRAGTNEEQNLFALLSSKLYNVSKQFFYLHHDYDTQGILYYLGTNKGTEVYKNPHTRGLVTASASSFENCPISQFVEIEKPTARLYTRNDPNQYFMVDFHELLIEPTHYTLSHKDDDNVPMHWSLYGGFPESDVWVRLKRHENDRSLFNYSHTWELDVTGYYSKFKIQHDGQNESRLHYFIIDRLEMYGKVLNL